MEKGMEKEGGGEKWEERMIEDEKRKEEERGREDERNKRSEDEEGRKRKDGWMRQASHEIVGEKEEKGRRGREEEEGKGKQDGGRDRAPVKELHTCQQARVLYKQLPNHLNPTPSHTGYMQVKIQGYTGNLDE